MKWKIKEKNKPNKSSEPILLGKKGPNIGDEKRVVKFAILPKEIDGYNVWLERYIEVYVYKEVYDRRQNNYDFFLYEESKFTSSGRILIKTPKWVLSETKFYKSEQ